MPLTALIESLSKPGSFPHWPKRAEVIQTHISVVFIAGDLVYKIKKPVDFGFLDFTTLEKRKFYCEQEVALNARLCPDVYLGVVPITDDGTRIAVRGRGHRHRLRRRDEAAPGAGDDGRGACRGEGRERRHRADSRGPRPVLPRRAHGPARQPIRDDPCDRAQLRRELQPDEKVYLKDDTAPRL